MSLSNNHITSSSGSSSSSSSNTTADKGKQVQLIFSGTTSNNVSNLNATKRTATDYGDDVNNKKLKGDINIQIKSAKSSTTETTTNSSSGGGGGGSGSSSSNSSSSSKEEAASAAEQQNAADTTYTLETSLPSSEITEEYVLFTTDVMDYMDSKEFAAAITSNKSNSSNASTTSTVPLNSNSANTSGNVGSSGSGSGSSLNKPKETADNNNKNVGEIELVVLPAETTQKVTTIVNKNESSGSATPTPAAAATPPMRRHTTSTSYNCSIEQQTTPTNATTLFTRNNIQTTIKNRPLIVSTKNRISEVTQTTAKVSIGNTTISVPLLKPLNATHIAAQSSSAAPTTVVATSSNTTQLNFSKILNVKRGQKIVNQPTIVSLSQLQIKPVSAAKIVQAKVLNKKMPLQLKHFTSVAASTATTTNTMANKNNSYNKLTIIQNVQQQQDDEESSTDNKSETSDGTTTTTAGGGGGVATEDNLVDNQNTNVMKNLNLLTTLGSNGSTVLTKVNTDMQQNKQQQQIRSTVSIIKQSDNNEQVVTTASATTTSTACNSSPVIKKLTNSNNNNNNNSSNNKGTLCLNTNSTSLIAIPRNISLVLAKSNANVTQGGKATSTAHILNSAAGKKLNPATSFNITTQRRMSQVSTDSPYKQAVISCVTMMKPLDGSGGNATTSSTTIRSNNSNNNNNTNNSNLQQQQQQQLLQTYKRAKSAEDRQQDAADKELTLTNNNNNNNNNASNNNTLNNKRQIPNDIITQAKRACLNEDQSQHQQQQTIGNKLTSTTTTTTTTINMTITTSSATTITSSIGAENTISNNNNNNSNNNNNKPEEAHNALLKQLLQNTTNTTIVSVAASNTTVATSSTNTTTTTATSRVPTNNTNQQQQQLTSLNNATQTTTATATSTAATTNSSDSYTPARKVINIRAPSLGLVSSLEAQLARPAIPPVPTPNATQIGSTGAAAGTTNTLTSVNAATTTTTMATATKTNLNRLPTTTTTTGPVSEQQQQQIQQQLLQQQTLMTTTSTTTAATPTSVPTTTTNSMTDIINDTTKHQQQHVMQQNMPNEQIQQQQQQQLLQPNKTKSNVQLILKETSFISNPNITQQHQQQQQQQQQIKLNHQLAITTTPTTSKSPPQELDRRAYNITVFSNVNNNNNNNNNSNNLNKTTTTSNTITEQDTTKQTLLDALLNNNNRHKMVTVTTTTTPKPHQIQQEQLNNDEKPQQQQQQKLLIIENNEGKNNKNSNEMLDTTTSATTHNSLEQLKVNTTTTTTTMIPAHINTDGSQTPTYMNKPTAMDNKQLANHSPSLLHSPTTTVDSPSSKDGDQRRKKKREYQKHRRQLINNNKANNNNNNNNFSAIKSNLNNTQQTNSASNAKKIRPRKLSKADEDYDNFIDNLMSHIRQMHPIQVLEPVLNRHYGVDNMYGTARQLAATMPQQQRQGKEHEHKSMSHNQLIGEYGKARRQHGTSLYESENINENLQQSNAREHGVIGASGEKRLPSIQNDFYDQEFSPILYKSEKQKLLRFIGFIRERNLDALEMIAAQGGESEKDKMLQEFPALTPYHHKNNQVIGRMSPVLPLVQPFSVKIRRYCMPPLDELQSNSGVEAEAKPCKSNDQTVFLSMPLLAADNVLAVLRDLANLLHIPAPSMYKIEAPHVLSAQPQQLFKRRCNSETYHSLQQILNGKRKMCRQCGVPITQKGYQAADNCVATLQTKLNLELPETLGSGRAHYCSKRCYVLAQLARKQQNNTENELKTERLSGKAIGGLDQEKSASTEHLSKSKKCRFRYYSAKCFNNNTQMRAVSEKEVTDMLFKMDITVAAKYAATNIDGNTVQRQLDDNRQCVFCNQQGDGLPDGPSRLLNFEVDKWVHLNCALWSNGVYETISGGLMNFQMALQMGLSQLCTHCQQYGATVKCFKPRCSTVYHLPCAMKDRCVFYKNKTIHCQAHAQRTEKENELTTLAVQRRVFVERDENSQVASVMHHTEMNNLLRVGSLTFLNVGQLLPHQLEAFHTPNYIYPIGYKIIRFYWSTKRPNKRCRYICSIADAGGRPEFRIQVQEPMERDLDLRDPTPKGVWQRILESIAALRKENELVQLFPQFISGEDLFGLTEPAIVRILESMPGIETLSNYRFKYGRNPLLELPLAINPSGAARAEPKQRHILSWRKPHTQRTGTPHNLRNATVTSPSVGGEVACPYSKQFVHSKSSQYKKMKQEWRNNVFLARSKIQGLGLYAARDMERHTMIIEYIGEVIRTEVSEIREKQYESKNRGIYMFRLDEERVVDATLSGGLARYINHSCNPNCVTEIVEVDRELRIIIFAKRRINRGEELSYDYKFDIEDDAHKIQCMCGAPNCRKWMN